MLKQVQDYFQKPLKEMYQRTIRKLGMFVQESNILCVPTFFSACYQHMCQGTFCCYSYGVKNSREKIGSNLITVKTRWNRSHGPTSKGILPYTCWVLRHLGGERIVSPDPMASPLAGQGLTTRSLMETQSNYLLSSYFLCQH